MQRQRFETSNILLALRSILWTVLMLGMAAGYIPWRFFGLNHAQLTLTNPVHILAPPPQRRGMKVP